MKKTILYSFILVALLAGLFASPASAEACGSTYTVQKGDYLMKIAQTCGISYDALLAANPQIKDPNIIRVGQVLRIDPKAALPDSSSGSSTSNTSGWEYTVVKGDTLYKISVRFGVSARDLINANPQLDDPSLLTVGQKLRIPYSSSTGMVTLSTTRARAGATVEVKVKGFPANMDIDFRLGKEGEAYSVVVDGRTDAEGKASAKITIPSSAKSGEKWLVKVLTTGMANGREATSALITITN